MKLFISTRLISLSLLSLLFIVACNEDPEPENEEELITEVLVLLNSDNSQTTLTFRDEDGDGGNPPVITGGSLETNTTYDGSITLNAPDESITAEIQEEDLEHQFFFSSDISDVSFSYSDQDSEGNPIGLLFSLETGEAAQGNMTVILRHEPNKSAEGVSEGDISNAGGETDIEITFPIDIQ